MPLKGSVLITVADRGTGILEPAKKFSELGFKIFAIHGTKKFLEKNGIDSQLINKIYEQRPNIADAIKNGEINLVINTPKGRLSEVDDSYIRKAAIKYKIPYITTTTAALAATKGIIARRNNETKVISVQEYHRGIE